MSLRKKIILSFLISSTIIAIFTVTAYLTFAEIREEIRYLELSDTVRSKTLQLRRHEKNFFLYRDRKEQELVHVYIEELEGILSEGKLKYGSGPLEALETEIRAYDESFTNLESLVTAFQAEFERIKKAYPGSAVLFPIIESTILERPLVNAKLLSEIFRRQSDKKAATTLRALNKEIGALRKTGEEIVSLSKDLDRSARFKAEQAIGLSQKATLLLFPLSLAVGLVALFMISHSVVKRIEILKVAIEKTAKGNFLSLPVGDEKDEVGRLMRTFNTMESALIARDKEIRKKNEELLQSKKLASLGTLASGVAHELNNPLNNIYLAAQILSKEMAGESFPPIIRETVHDIFSETLRVKRIVSDLLEFAREKVPELKPLNIAGLIEDVLSKLLQSGTLSGITLNVEMPHDVMVLGDRLLLEQVFINLFSNAAEAMNGTGTLTISVGHAGGTASVEVSDTGQGIGPDDIARIFDPFFTTKEKGTGLGLSIVYNIVRKHNGTIAAKSTPGKGTAFSLSLPEAQ